MATLVKTIDKSFSSYYTLRLNVYIDSQSVSANTSSVYVVGQLIAASGAYISSSASKSWSCTINGTTLSGTCTVGISGGQTKTLFTTSKVSVAHSADGTKSISVSGTLAIKVTLNGSYVSSVTASGTATLTAIPRNTGIKSATSVSVNGTNKSTVTLNSPAVSTYTHKVTWSIGSYSYTATLAAGTTTASYAIPESWKNAFPSAKSGSCTVKVYTYSGSTQIGSAASTTITLSCLGTETPSFTLTMSDAAGIYSKIGCYVVGQTKLKAALSGITYQYGATLKSVSITMDGTTYTGTSTSATASTTLKSSGNQTVTATLTDSRGYAKTVTTTITGYTYTSPTMTIGLSRYKLNEDGTYEKDDEGGYGRLSYTVTYSQIGTNSITVKVEYKSNDGLDSGSIELTDAETVQYIACDTEKAYAFTITLSDVLKSAKYTKPLSSAITIMDILKGGKGVNFGGVATEKEILASAWKIHATKGIQSDLPLYLNNGTLDNVTVSSGTGQKQIFELPAPVFGDGYYHYNIVVAFSANATGRRLIQCYKSTDGGTTKTGVGWSAMDIQHAVDGEYTVCHIDFYTPSADTTLYVYGYQNSGSDLTALCRYSYYRLV